MDEEFEAVWTALVENGTSKRNKEPTYRFWLSLTPEQRHLAFLNITKKAQNDGFLNYDPIKAIRENSRFYKNAKGLLPINYNGEQAIDGLMKTNPLVSASFRGHYGVYLLAPALEWKMDIARGVNFSYKLYKQTGKVITHIPKSLKIISHTNLFHLP